MLLKTGSLLSQNLFHAVAWARVQVLTDLTYLDFYNAIRRSLALLPALLDPAELNNTTHAQSMKSAPNIRHLEYFTKRFTSSVLTSLICKVPLLTSSVEEHTLLGKVGQRLWMNAVVALRPMHEPAPCSPCLQVYPYLLDAGALLGPSDCPLSGAAELQQRSEQQRQRSVRRSKSDTLDCQERLEAGHRALSLVADRLNSQFVSMLHEWLDKGAARIKESQVEPK